MKPILLGSLALLDLTGDGRVTGRDLVAEMQAIRRGDTSPRYDVNGDGRLDLRDLIAVVRQLGRRC